MFTEPVLCEAALVQSCLSDFSPAHHLFAIGVHDALHALDKAHILVVRRGAGFVAANVDIRTGRERFYLADDIINKFICDFLVYA